MADEIPCVRYAARSKRDEEKDSTGSQIEEIERRIAELGGRVVYGRAFKDEASGYSKSRGPDLDAALACAIEAADEHGQAELWGFHSSRYARGSGSKNEARSLNEIHAYAKRNGVKLRSVEDDEFVTNEMLVGFAAATAHKYSQDLSSHTKRGKRAQVERGERLGGPTADGYVDITRMGDDGKPYTVREIDPTRAPVFERMVTLYETIGYGPVTRALNAEGYRLKNGKPWTKRRVVDALTNPFYAGLNFQRGEMVGGNYRRFAEPKTWPGSHPAIIEPERFARLQELRRARSKGRKQGGRPTTRYILSTLAKCEDCGETMYAVTSPYVRKDGTRQRRYVCKSVHSSTGTCDAAAVDAETIDSLIVAHLQSYFVDFDRWLASVTEGVVDRRAAIEKGVAVARERVAKLDRVAAKAHEKWLDALDSDRDEEIIYAAYEKVVREREQAQHRLAELDEMVASIDERERVDAMFDFWNDLKAALSGRIDRGSVEQVNAGLRELFTAFVVKTLPEGVRVTPVPNPELPRVLIFESDEPTWASLFGLGDTDPEPFPTLASGPTEIGTPPLTAALSETGPHSVEYSPVSLIPPLLVPADPPKR